MDPIRVVNWLREDAICKIKGKQGWLKLVLYDPSVVAERCKSYLVSELKGRDQI